MPQVIINFASAPSPLEAAVVHLSLPPTLDIFLIKLWGIKATSLKLESLFHSPHFLLFLLICFVYLFPPFLGY